MLALYPSEDSIFGPSPRLIIGVILLIQCGMTTYTFERRGERIHVDEYGNEFVLDEKGNRRPPMYSKIVKESCDWPEYDTTQGHCGLCGRLGCHSNCIQGGS